MHDAFEEFRFVGKRHAAISGAMFVSATEAVIGVPEKNRSRRHQFAAGEVSILERSADDDGDRRAHVALFERLVMRSGAANDVRHSPAIPAAEYAYPRRIRCLTDRNFCQEFRSPQALYR